MYNKSFLTRFITYYTVLDNYSKKPNMLCEMFFLFQYRVLIYASKQQQVTTGKIHTNFSFTVIFIDINVNSFNM